MLVTFYGVRGSIPTPGNEFVKYGGNTACVHVALDDGTNIVLDSGTGIRNLGKELLKSNSPVHILLSHNHWDHIQGFPFFKPLYQPKRNIFITPGLTDENRPEGILEQMKGSFFPVPREAIAANVSFQIYSEHSWSIGEAKINRLKMNHPGGGSCYTIEHKDLKLAYITDNELYPPYKKNTDFLEFVAFAKDADLLIHDAQYITEDMPEKSGWGHSVAEEAVKLALACNVKQLALYSHDPEREDEMIDSIVEQASLIIEAGGGNTTCVGASEGMSVKL